jgi:hypothetical protein
MGDPIGLMKDAGMRNLAIEKDPGDALRWRGAIERSIGRTLGAI